MGNPADERCEHMLALDLPPGEVFETEELSNLLGLSSRHRTWVWEVVEEEEEQEEEEDPPDPVSDDGRASDPLDGSVDPLRSRPITPETSITTPSVPEKYRR